MCEGIPYKVEVGSFMYAIHVEGQSTALDAHCIMRYLKDNLDFRLCLRDKNIVLRGFCNAEWEGDANGVRVFLLAME